MPNRDKQSGVLNATVFTIEPPEMIEIEGGSFLMGTSDDQHPNAMGFDDWFGFLGGGLMYYPLNHPSYRGRFTPPIKRPMKHKYLQHTLPLIHNREPVEWDQYLTRELTDAGIRFLDRNQETPFFLEKNQKPDLIRLNIVVDGSGTVWVDEVVLARSAR